jgi:hypothetical protein
MDGSIMKNTWRTTTRFFILRTTLLALGSTQPLTEMSTRNLSGGGGAKGRPTRKADNHSAIYEPIV